MTKPVFISYSTHDTAAAEHVRDGLEKSAIACWMAPRDIVPGLDYGSQIVDAIEACTVLVLVLSESSNYSVYVRKEVERAIAKDKVVIPVRIQEVAVSRSLEFFISDAQWIDAWGEPLSGAVPMLYNAVRGHMEKRAQVRDVPLAEGWHRAGETDSLSSPTHLPSPTHQPPVERALFVGREAQLSELESALNQTLAGHGQLRFVTGEAGAGKSALLSEFQYRAQEEAAGLVVASGACDAATGSADPYLPFREILTTLANPDVGGQLVQELGPDLIDTLIPRSALGAHVSPRGGAPGSKPVEQSQIVEQTVTVLRAIAQRIPLILVLEDLHWVDDASMGLLFRLGRQLEGNRILLLGTYRSEEMSLGRGDGSHPLQKIVDELRRNLGSIHIDLDAARETEGIALVDALLDTEPNRLDAAFRQELYAHTGGHPLFVVELLRDLQSDGGLVKDADGAWTAGAELSWADIPDRVEGIIAVRMARLDDEERQLLTTASVMGEHFIAEAVAQTLHIDGREVAQQLSSSLQKQHRMVQAEGRERLGNQRLTRYRFSHSLMQVYLYGQLDAVELGFLHEDIGIALEELYGEQTGTIAVQLARHFQAADLPEKAANYLIMAGEGAARVSAHTEAINYFSRALSLLAELPENPENLQQRFSAHFALGLVARASKGSGSPEEETACNQALAIARKLGDNRKITQTLQQMTFGAIMRGDLAQGRAYGEECLRLAEADQDAKLQMQVNQSLRMIAHASGRHADAVAYADQILATYREHRLTLSFDDLGTVAQILTLSGLNLVPAGYPDRALRQAQEGLELAQSLDHHYASGHNLGLIAYIHLLRGDWPAVLQGAREARDFARHHNTPQLRTMAEAFEGLALVRLGETEVGIERVKQALADREAMGFKFGNQTNFVRLAEACGQTGRVAYALTLVNGALPHIASDRQYEPKYHQIKGDLLLLQDLSGDDMAMVQNEAEACFRQAIEIARAGGAKLWEARAMASLCRLLDQQGRGQECRRELANLYAWFTEGFETEDLRVVKAVLDD